MPDVDISNWQTIFDSLQKLNKFIIIEDDINEQFAIGIIEKTFKNKLYFKSFDADGIWDNAGLEIPYSQITSVKWDCRYADTWEKYMFYMQQIQKKQAELSEKNTEKGEYTHCRNKIASVPKFAVAEQNAANQAAHAVGKHLPRCPWSLTKQEVRYKHRHRSHQKTTFTSQ